MHSRRDKERSRTQDFTMVHPSSRATSNPLKLAVISTKRSPRSALQDTILLPAETTHY